MKDSPIYSLQTFKVYLVFCRSSRSPRLCYICCTLPYPIQLKNQLAKSIQDQAMVHI